MIFAFLAVNASSQVYLWRDDGGKEHRTSDFAKVPQDKLSIQCVTKSLSVLSGECLIVEGGHVVRLIGVDVASGSLSWDKTRDGQAQRRLQELVAGKILTLSFDQNFKNSSHQTLVYIHTDDGTFLNEVLLAEGLAALIETSPTSRHKRRLAAAEKSVKTQHVGMWRKRSTKAKKPVVKPIKGFSLGLYSRQDSYDYLPFLREQVAIGATDILLITPWFLEHFTSCQIVPKPQRSCSLAVVSRVIRQARALGLRVAVMPIILLWKPDDDHWRGNIAPKDQEDWFLAYQEFIGAFASLAEDAGAQELLVGSEFSSLEKDEVHWREVIRGIRRRFSGILSYSANWDHLVTIKWWDALDAVGMTGYHSLTKSDNPSVEELTKAWQRIRKELESILEHIARPYFFSEMGYASLDGINKDPWDYVSPKKTDNQEQADCFEAWFRAWQNPPAKFRGAFFYTWWRNQDADDKRQYTVHGKPAADIIRKWYTK